MSLAVVETCAAALWPDHRHAAVAVPDGRKGEQIVLVTDQPGRQPRTTWWAGRKITASPNWRCRAGSSGVDDIPVLGTGKTDYVKVQKMLPTEGQAT